MTTAIFLDLSNFTGRKTLSDRLRKNSGKQQNRTRVVVNHHISQTIRRIAKYSYNNNKDTQAIWHWELLKELMMNGRGAGAIAIASTWTWWRFVPIWGQCEFSWSMLGCFLFLVRSISNVCYLFWERISQIQSRVSMDTIRPLHQFLGVSGNNLCFSPEAFAPPTSRLLDKSTPEKFKSRLKLNISFFLSNYVLVASGVSLVIALMHVGMLLFLGFLYGMWAFHSFLISNEVIVFGRNIGTIISLNHRSALLTAITILVVVWKCLVPTITAIAISGILILSHAIMRDPKHIDTSVILRKDSDDEGTSSDSEVMVERPQVSKDVAWYSFRWGILVWSWSDIQIVLTYLVALPILLSYLHPL